MGLLLAARASISKIQTSNDSGTITHPSNTDLTNLVRIKQTTLNKLNTDIIGPIRTRKSNKIKGLYKIQKTYRFHANYRLHCIRLRYNNNKN